ncbi:YqcC family protein [Thalassotalea fonticola]|uniref:YqcC family protein n=1 Tax=Thalassotalea fonticola TaxID=3065649 RepID=A0ABZ0GR01_9GAMM|nr:YqcC family protein [Colwelliaceae bacterium S1-1]
MANSKHLLVLLSKLAAELKALNLWQQQRPTEQELSSLQPFCIDTLTFAQWLQFIFIERMKALVADKMALPAQISLCPMAEESFKHKGELAANLINLIADIDELLSGKREQSLYVRK